MNNCNVPNRTIFCQDNLEIMQGMNSSCVDLIYLDPPFNTKKIFAAPIGAAAEGASFRDIFTKEDIKEDWIHEMREGDDEKAAIFIESVRDIDRLTHKNRERDLYNYCYMAYMGIRLIEMRRILKETGSIYLHCDPTMSHYLKILMDCIFGEKNFKNEVIWYYSNKIQVKANKFLSSNDIIYFYTKGRNYTFNHLKKKGERVLINVERGYASATRFHNSTRIKTLRVYNNKKLQIAIQEKKIDLNSFDEVRDYTHKTGDRLIDNVWSIPYINSQAKEKTGYPTQKPIALLERIINASSTKDLIIFDPFCGCATTCVAAEKLQRQWVGIDISIKAYELVQTRIKDEIYEEGLLKSEDGALPSIHFRIDAPTRTDKGEHPIDTKYVYIISNPNFTGKYKVGYATSVAKRLNSYQTGDPNRKFKVEYSVQTEHYRAMEKYLHTTFNGNYEWVAHPLEELKNAADEFISMQESGLDTNT